MQRLLQLLRLGLVHELRNSSLRRPALAAAILTGLAAVLLRNSPAYASIALGDWLGSLYGLAGGVWVTTRAATDLHGGKDQGALFRAKPGDGAQRLLVDWVCGIGLWLVLLAGGFLMPVAIFAASGATGLLSPLAAMGRAATQVIILVTLAFTATRALRWPPAGILATIGWFVLDPAFRRWGISAAYAQNSGAWLLLVVLGVVGVALILERSRRGEPYRHWTTAAVLGALAMSVFGSAALAYRGRPTHTEVTATWWRRMEAQELRVGDRIPGLSLPDGRGGILRTADYPGKILLVLLFSASDPEAVASLEALQSVQREFGTEGVQPLGVCISPNVADRWAIARVGEYRFPIGLDTSATASDRAPASAVMRAYQAAELPLLVVTDRQRIVRQIRHEGRLEAGILRNQVAALVAQTRE